MKKVFLQKAVVVLVFAMVISLFTACDKDYKMPEGIRIAMISSPADINDTGYNKTVYEACRKFSDKNNIPFRYYRSISDTADSYLSMIDAAINDEYNIIVLIGNFTARATRTAAEANPEIKFIAVDVGQEDYGKNYVIPSNLTCWVFGEEYAGFMVGYAAVKEGYRHLGFLGGIAVPAVLRYGYGFVQGANAAAKEVGANVEIEFAYANQFYGDPDITAYMENWYFNKNVEVVFSCGGDVWTSVATAAKEVKGKMIGVDIDQREGINKYTGQDTVITSAMKSLDNSVEDILNYINEGNWDQYGGKSRTLALISGTEPEKNYLQLPSDNWRMKNFTYYDYCTLTQKLYNGEYKVSNDIIKHPAAEITVHYRGTIK